MPLSCCMPQVYGLFRLQRWKRRFEFWILFIEFRARHLCKSQSLSHIRCFFLQVHPYHINRGAWKWIVLWVHTFSSSTSTFSLVASSLDEINEDLSAFSDDFRLLTSSSFPCSLAVQSSKSSRILFKTFVDAWTWASACTGRSGIDGLLLLDQFFVAAWSLTSSLQSFNCCWTALSDLSDCSVFDFCSLRHFSSA